MARAKQTKPEKVLREDLEQRKKALESKGWEFQLSGSNLEAAKKFPLDAYRTRISGANSIELLLAEAARLEERAAADNEKNLKTKSALENAPSADLVWARPCGARPDYLFESKKLPKDEKKRRAKIETLLAEYERDLAKDVARYNQIINENAPELPDWDPANPIGNLILKISHISYAKQHINGCLVLLGRQKRFPEGDSPNINLMDLEWRFSDPIVTSEKPAFSINETSGEFSPDAAQIPVSIPLTQIIPSPFEPQARRRARFTADEIAELGNSIIKQGLFSPIVVRPVTVDNRPQNAQDATNFYEIVFGERRFLAAARAGAREIRAFVRPLTDAEVLEMQYQENHQRRQNSPLDDAFTFAYLRDHENYSIEKLADRFGTSKAEVVKKLKLNELIPEAVEQMEAGHLPLRHAYYLSRFPAAAQKEILAEGWAYEWGEIENGAVSYSEFKEEVEENVIRHLADAPFDKADARLHIKGLKCVDCTERTGYEPLLFGGEIKGRDSCLNRQCFEIKTNTHLRLKREEIAMQAPSSARARPDEAVKKVPLVTEKNYADADNPWQEKPLTGKTLYEKPECDYAQAALAVDGEKKGEQVYICNNGRCPVHHAKEKPEERQLSEWDLKQKERELQRRINNRLRARVFQESLDWFDENKFFWQFKDLVERLLVESLYSANYDCKKQIFSLISSWENAPTAMANKPQIAAFVRSLAPVQFSRLFFLLAYAGELSAGWSFENTPEETAEIRALARGFTNLDYRLLDAEIRAELAPAEFKEQAADYLARVKSGDAGEPPPYFYFDFSASGADEDDSADENDMGETSQG